jgi:hypothetical protein
MVPNMKVRQRIRTNPARASLVAKASGVRNFRVDSGR